MFPGDIICRKRKFNFGDGDGDGNGNGIGDGRRETVVSPGGAGMSV